MEGPNQRSRQAEILKVLRDSADRVHGPGKAEEVYLRESLEAAATAICRVEQEELEAMDIEPWCND